MNKVNIQCTYNVIIYMTDTQNGRQLSSLRFEAVSSGCRDCPPHLFGTVQRAFSENQPQRRV